MSTTSLRGALDAAKERDKRGLMRTVSLKVAQEEAKRVGGHIRCVHYDTRWEYAVYAGKDPRGDPDAGPVTQTGKARAT